MISNNKSFNNLMGGYKNLCFCTKSYFRIFNAIKNSPSLEVHINEILLTSNLCYGEFSNYMKFMPGSYKIKIYRSGGEKEILYETNIEIGRNHAYTCAFTGGFIDSQKICTYVIGDYKERIDMKDMASIKIVNFISDSEPLELATSDGTLLYTSLNYGEVANNVVLPSARYDLYIQENENNILLKANKVNFEPKMYYTLFLIGEYKGKRPKIELIIPEDGLNFLDLC